MYQSKVSLSYRTTSENKRDVKKYLSDHKNHKCSILRRRITLHLYYESNVNRKDASMRFASFLTGIDILKKSKNITKSIKDGFKCYEVQGLAKNKELVMVHVREEEAKTGRQLFLISTFYKK